MELIFLLLAVFAAATHGPGHAVQGANVILKAPDAHCAALSISNADALVVTTAACPSSLSVLELRRPDGQCARLSVSNVNVVTAAIVACSADLKIVQLKAPDGHWNYLGVDASNALVIGTAGEP